MDNDLNQELARLRHALACTGAGTWAWDTETQALTLDARAQQLVELPLGTSERSSLAAVELRLQVQDLDVWRAAWRDAIAGNHDTLNVDVRIAHSGPTPTWVGWRGQVQTRDAEGQATHIAGVVLDIQALKQAEMRLAAMAQRDPLTDLPNRALLADRLAHAMASARRNRTAFVVMDVRLEGLAPIHDALGRDMVDLVIRQAARRMATCTRASDSVARTGDEEFVLLLENVEGHADAMAVAEKLLHHIKDPLVVDGHWLEVTASIGLAMYPAHDDDLDALQQHAAEASAAALQAGGNRVAVFTPPAASNAPAPTEGSTP